MAFLAPGFFYAALAAAAAVVALHLIVTHQPRAVVLPTARFVPDVPAVATSRAVRPYDLFLLLLRVLILLAAGAALARPILKPRRERVARVIVADVSASVASPSEVADSVRRLYRPGDVTVPFDSIAHDTIRSDSLPRIGSGRAAPGSLSAALVAALRAAPTVREGADSIELVLISALGNAEHDSATAPIRALWPGRARLVHVAGDTVSVSGEPHIWWTSVGRPPLSTARSRPDTANAVVADNNVVIAPFQRRWMFSPDSLRGATVIARWVDGEPAAVERANAVGCERSIAIPVDSTGDLVLRPEFIRFRRVLTGPCRRSVASGGSSAPLISSLRGTGGLASASLFPAPRNIQSLLAPWLMGAALALSIVELLVRRRRTES